MRHDVRPEPSGDEREALERVLRPRDENEQPAYRSSWRRAGLDADEPDDALVRARTRGGPRVA